MDMVKFMTILNGYSSTFSDNADARKTEAYSNPKTVGETLVCELKNGKIFKHDQSRKSSDNIRPASTKGIRLSNPKDMSKVKYIWRLYK